MRKLLLFFLLFYNYGKTLSQNLNVAHHSYIDNVHGLTSINNKHFYLERIISKFFGDSTNLVGLNEAGKIIFKMNFSFNEANLPVRIMTTLDKCILVLGLANGCDVDADPTNFIFKIDTTGAVKFQTQPQFLVNGSVDMFRDCVQHPDSSYYFLSDSLLYHYSKTGQFISSFGNGLTYASTMAFMNNGNFLIHGYTASLTLKNIEMNTSGTLIMQQNGTEDLRMVLQAQSGNFFGLTFNGTILKLNSALVSVGNTSISLTNTVAINAFALKNDSIFFTGVRSSLNNPVYGILDQGFNALYFSQSTYKNIFPSAITINNQNIVNIASKATSSLSPYNTFLSFYQCPQNGSFVSKFDIGVESFTAVNSSYPLNAPYIDYILDVKVRNYTNDTIKSFCLNAEGNQLICGYNIYHQQFNALILPLASAIVRTGIVESPILGAVTQTPGFQFSNKLCVFTTVPNQQNDIEINNDQACATLQMAVGIDTQTPNAFRPNVFPNPMNNILNLESETEIKKIAIYDAIGNLRDEFMVNNKNFSFDCSNLKNGVYILKVENDQGVQIKKVVKN